MIVLLDMTKPENVAAAVEADRRQRERLDRELAAACERVATKKAAGSYCGGPSLTAYFRHGSRVG